MRKTLSCRSLLWTVGITFALLALTACSSYTSLFAIEDAIVYCGSSETNPGDTTFYVERSSFGGTCAAFVWFKNPRPHVRGDGPGVASLQLELEVENIESLDDSGDPEDVELQVCQAGSYERCIGFRISTEHAGHAILVENITGLNVEPDKDGEWKVIVRMDPDGVFRGRITFSGGNLIGSSSDRNNAI